jgi:hypothetical protein
MVFQLDISNNLLCGIDKDGNAYDDPYGGTYIAEGITAIADALRVNGGLTSVKLRGNKLGEEGWGAIFAAICSNKDSKIMSMDVSDEDIGPAGVKLIAEVLRTSVTGRLTSLGLSSNQLCGVDPYGEGTYTAEGITAIADALRVHGSLTQVLAFCLRRDAFSVTLNLVLALNGFAAGPLNQPAVRQRGPWKLHCRGPCNLHCRGHHSYRRRSARQQRADGAQSCGQLNQGRGHHGNL